MGQVTLKGNPVTTSGSLPTAGSTAPAFTLVGGDLSEKTLGDFAGKTKVLTINPSFDTGVCEATARKFNEALGARNNVAVLAISADLPFAQKRMCEANGLSHVVALSCFRSSFSTDYGVKMTSGPLQGLCARSVVVIDENDKVIASQLVPEIVQEPDYDAILSALGA